MVKKSQPYSKTQEEQKSEDELHPYSTRYQTNKTSGHNDTKNQKSFDCDKRSKEKPIAKIKESIINSKKPKRLRKRSKQFKCEQCGTGISHKSTLSHHKNNVCKKYSKQNSEIYSSQPCESSPTEVYGPIQLLCNAKLANVPATILQHKIEAFTSNDQAIMLLNEEEEVPFYRHLEGFLERKNFPHSTSTNIENIYRSHCNQLIRNQAGIAQVQCVQDQQWAQLPIILSKKLQKEKNYTKVLSQQPSLENTQIKINKYEFDIASFLPVQMFKKQISSADKCIAFLKYLKKIENDRLALLYPIQECLHLIGRNQDITLVNQIKVNKVTYDQVASLFQMIGLDNDDVQDDFMEEANLTLNSINWLQSSYQYLQEKLVFYTYQYANKAKYQSQTRDMISIDYIKYHDLYWHQRAIIDNYYKQFETLQSMNQVFLELNSHINQSVQGFQNTFADLQDLQDEHLKDIPLLRRVDEIFDHHMNARLKTGQEVEKPSVELNPKPDLLKNQIQNTVEKQPVIVLLEHQMINHQKPPSVTDLMLD